MFTVMFTTKFKPEAMDEIWGMTQKAMENYQHPPGLIEAISLIDSSESTIVKLLFWESEEHYNDIMGSEKVKESMQVFGHLLAGPPKVETFDTVIKATRSYAGVM